MTETASSITRQHLSPQQASTLLSRYLREANASKDPRGAQPVGYYRGSSSERRFGQFFVGAMIEQSGSETAFPDTTYESIFNRLDPYRMDATEDPERPLSAGALEAIRDLPVDSKHPALVLGNLMVQGLNEGQFRAAALAEEAELAIRIELAMQAVAIPRQREA